MKKIIRIATRKSPLALWQASFIKAALLKIDPDLDIIFIGLTTTGDTESTNALTLIGGKRLFVKELQQALLNNTADIAVHSMKDLSIQPCPGLTLAAICEREDPRDALISTQYASIQDLPTGAVVGTASPRRMALLKSQRQDVQIKTVRGNVGTRLNKCQQSGYDAILLAVAGLKRLGLDHHITEYLSPTVFIPAIGQGAIGVECREKDTELRALIHVMHHDETASCVSAERAVNRIVGGDCHTPIAAHAMIVHQQLHIRSMVGSTDGKILLHDERTGSPTYAVSIGETLGQQLLEQGAGLLLNKEQ